MASALFSPIALRGLTLPNRITVSPMCQYASENGSATDWHLMHLGTLSLGGAALVMTEMTDVNPAGRVTAKCAAMSVGLITEPKQAADIIASGRADMIALARAAMWNPRWAWHAAEALGAETAYAPKMMLCHPKLRPQVFPNRLQPA